MKKLIIVLLLICLAIKFYGQTPYFKKPVTIDLIQSSTMITFWASSISGFMFVTSEGQVNLFDGKWNAKEKYMISAVCLMSAALYLNHKESKNQYIFRFNTFKKEKYITLIIRF